MRRAAALCALVAILSSGTAAVAGTPLFADVTAGSGIPALRFGEGVNAVDLDDDGLPELFLPCVRGRDRLYRNLGGLRFADVTDAWGVTGEGGIGAAIGDLDRNGSPEIVVVRGAWPSGSVTLLSRGKDGRLHDSSKRHRRLDRRLRWGRRPGPVRLRVGRRPALPQPRRPPRFRGSLPGSRSGRSRAQLGGAVLGPHRDGRPDLVVTRGGKGSSETTRLFVNAGGRFEGRTASTATTARAACATSPPKAASARVRGSVPQPEPSTGICSRTS